MELSLLWHRFAITNLSHLYNWTNLFTICYITTVPKHTIEKKKKSSTERRSNSRSKLTEKRKLEEKTANTESRFSARSTLPQQRKKELRNADTESRCSARSNLPKKQKVEIRKIDSQCKLRKWVRVEQECDDSNPCR
jgi:hypothetical protein